MPSLRHLGLCRLCQGSFSPRSPATARVQCLCPISSPNWARSPRHLRCHQRGKARQYTQHLGKAVPGLLKRKNPSLTGFNHLNVFHKTERLVGRFGVVAVFLQSERRCEGEKPLNGDSALAKSLRSDYLRDSRKENTGDLTMRKDKRKASPSGTGKRKHLQLPSTAAF